MLVDFVKIKNYPNFYFLSYFFIICHKFTFLFFKSQLYYSCNILNICASAFGTDISIYVYLINCLLARVYCLSNRTLSFPVHK